MPEHLPRSVYRFNLLWFVGCLAAGTGSIIIAVGMVVRLIRVYLQTGQLDVFDVMLAVPLFVLMFGFGALILTMLITVRLVITPEGLHYDTLAYRAFAPWDHVSRVEQISHFTTGREEAILVLDPDVHLRGWTRHAKWHIEPDPDWMIIEVSRFMLGWRHRKLGRELRHYAPQLFAPDARSFHAQ
jgi:hypothetical protein